MLPVTWSTVRLFLHVLAATVWVGGQLTLAGLVPVVRRLGPDATRAVARQFNRIAWPAFAVVVVTGIWNIVEVDVPSASTEYQVTLAVKLVLVTVSGVGAAVHIVGARRWNRRGAMVTDRYQHVQYHPTIDDLVGWAGGAELPLVGIDNIAGSVPLESTELPERCVLLFGQEGPGLSQTARSAATMVCSITMYGSTRSINAAGGSSDTNLRTSLVAMNFAVEG